MGTKNNPGTFDCYANAEPDEPMFVLLGRDPVAPVLVELWAELRRRVGYNENDKAKEATQCAAAMAAFAAARSPEKGRASVKAREIVSCWIYEANLPNADEARRFVIAYRHMQQRAKEVTEWMTQEGNAGRLRRNSDAPMWAEYQDAVSKWAATASESFLAAER